MARGPRKPYERPEHGKAPEGAWTHDRAPGTERARAAVQAASSGAGLSTKIVVSNLHYEVSVKDLIAIFGQIGTLVREPNIRYDRSGRSTGVAIITFETPEEATQAKAQFDGILAKGQPMAISYDAAAPPSRPRTRSSSAPPPSLMNRLEKAPLSERFSKDDDPTNGGPVRRGRRGGAAATAAPRGKKAAPASRQPRVKAKPKTAEDLDKELEAFMGGSGGGDSASDAKAMDVDMS